MYDKLSTSLLAEFIGTFALIFIGAGAGALNEGGVVGTAFAHGSLSCQAGYQHRCTNGAWERLASFC